MAFGDALIQAYKLEQGDVRYPRVMITKDVAADLSAMTKRDKFGYNLRNSVALSDDGPRFLDVLLQLVVNLRDNKDEETRLNALARYNETAAKIQLCFEDSRDNPQHFEKVQWFARYWNRVAVPWGVKAITRPGPDGVSTVHV
jgi:hypothetical protein